MPHIGDAHMVVARIEVQAFLHRDGARNILPSVPVEPVGRRGERLAEALHLLGFVATPGRIADFRHPDLRARIIAIQNGAHLGQMLLVAPPGIGLAVPGPRKPVKSNSRDRA